MTIQKAIESGRPFKREGYTKGYFQIPMFDLAIQYEGFVIALNKDDILADDWIILSDDDEQQKKGI